MRSSDCHLKTPDRSSNVQTARGQHHEGTPLQQPRNCWPAAWRRGSEEGSGHLGSLPLSFLSCVGLLVGRAQLSLTGCLGPLSTRLSPSSHCLTHRHPAPASSFMLPADAQAYRIHLLVPRSINYACILHGKKRCILALVSWEKPYIQEH